MEDYIKIRKFECVKKLTNKDYQIFSKKLYSQKGIIKFSINEYQFRIEYNSYLIDIKDIVTLLENLGYQFHAPKKVGRLQKFIQNLAKTNEKSFGTGKLECCKLNE